MRGPRYSFLVLRVAAVQVATSLDREANRTTAVDRVRRAAAEGASLVVLPEATMCAFGEATTDLVARAEPLDGPFVRALHRVAGETGATVVAGTFESAGEPGRAGSSRRVHNTIVVVDGGGLVGAYRKLHLYDALGWRESDRIAPGDPGGLVTFPLGGLVVGVMNCYDLRFPEMARALVDRGATVLLVPANWIPGPGKVEAWETLLRARAIESTAYVVGAAKPGPECTGRSVVIDPAGAVLASAPADGEAMLLADLEPERVAEVRAAMPVLAHRRFAVVPAPVGIDPSRDADV